MGTREGEASMADATAADATAADATAAGATRGLGIGADMVDKK